LIEDCPAWQTLFYCNLIVIIHFKSVGSQVLHM